MAETLSKKSVFRLLVILVLILAFVYFVFFGPTVPNVMGKPLSLTVTPTQTPAQTPTTTSPGTGGSGGDAAMGLPPRWLVLALAGMFGGLMYGMKDRQLILPHSESTKVIVPGFVADMLFGLAGGFVIFLALPGKIEYTNVNDWEFIKFISLAFVGGYGGRALVEKVLQSQLKDLEHKVQSLEGQAKSDGDARAMLSRYLEKDPDKPVPVSDLKEAIKAASDSLKVEAFNKAREFRRKALDIKKPADIGLVIPIFEAFIEGDTEQKYHRNYGELAFSLKDKDKPEWKKAEEVLSKAIEVRDKNKSEGFLVYEFNRALCRINLNASKDDILKDLDKATAAEKANEWIRNPDPVRGADLINWLKRNQVDLQNWITANKITLPAQAPAPPAPPTP